MHRFSIEKSLSPAPRFIDRSDGLSYDEDAIIICRPREVSL